MKFDKFTVSLSDLQFTINCSMGTNDSHIRLIEEEASNACMDVLYQFSDYSLKVKSEGELYKIIIRSLQEFQTELKCAIYTLDMPNNVYITRHDSGDNNFLTEISVDDLLIKKLVNGGQTIKIDSTKDLAINHKRVASAVLSPIKHQHKIYAFIFCEYRTPNSFQQRHIKLFDVIALQASNILLRINEFDKVRIDNIKYEESLEKKSEDLDKTIETLATKYSELKYQYEKQTTLIQEVHHRVSNNLQVISSILRLYLNENSPSHQDAIKEIYDRIQIMSIVHQNVYKSMEDEFKQIGVDSFMRDICNYLSSITDKIRILATTEVEIKYLPLDTLVPLGLLMTEFFYTLIDKAISKDLNSLEILISISKSSNSSLHSLFISSSVFLPINENGNIQAKSSLNEILIEALVDQLGGKLSVFSDQKHTFRFDFNL
ncbi:MAG: hypothetical protein H3C31_04865 [Brumimicrobium sp.]|nr:hypothetical protein [Brumimicrobium sp.]